MYTTTVLLPLLLASLPNTSVCVAKRRVKVSRIVQLVGILTTKATGCPAQRAAVASGEVSVAGAKARSVPIAATLLQVQGKHSCMHAIALFVGSVHSMHICLDICMLT